MPTPFISSPPPADALAWFRAKGLKLGFDYRDVWREEHAIAFTVAKMMQLDLLADVRAAVDQALAEGQTFRDFQKRLTPVLQEKGWWGVQERVDPLTGEVKQVQLGSPRRLRVIYDTNLRTARAAGQWERIQRTKDSLPYLLYTVGPSREHRPEHLSWHGTLLPVDDPFWKTHAPPSGWGCRCRIRQVSHWEYERLLKNGIPAPATRATQEIDPKTGLPTGRHTGARVPVSTTAPKTSLVEWTNKRTGEAQKIPRGIDPGWDYNPGEGRQAHLEKLLTEKTRSLMENGLIDSAPPKKPLKIQSLPNVEISERLSAQFLNDIDQAIATLPDGVLGALSEHGNALKIASQLKELFPELSGKRIPGDPSGRCFDQLSGLYHQKNKSIVVFEYVMDESPPFSMIKNSRAAGTLRHELGHALDRALGHWSSHPDFKRAYDLDVEAIQDDAVIDEYAYYLTQKGPSELFAELFAVLHGGGADQKLSHIKRVFPSTLAALSQRLEQQS